MARIIKIENIGEHFGKDVKKNSSQKYFKTRKLSKASYARLGSFT